MKKKVNWLIVISIIILVLACTITGYIFLKPKVDKDIKEVVNNYTMYVKTDNLYKINYEEKYSICNDELYSSKNYTVKSFEIIDKQKDLNDIKLENKDIKDALVELINLDSEITNIVIYSNALELKDDEIKSYIQENTTLTEDNIDINLLEKLNEEDIINNEVVKEYKVVFDSNGGSFINPVMVKEGEVLTKPENPTRDGYTFSKWTLDDKEYDFKSVVTSDLVLKASWEKKKTSDKTTTTTTPSTNKKAESTIDKINLNDNTTTSIDYTNYVQPVGYYFITNLAEVFPSLANKSYIYLSWEEEDPSKVDCDLRIDEWYANFDKFKFDTAKENKAKETLAGIKNKNYRGVIFETSVGSTYYNNETKQEYNENHEVSYKYEYIMVPNKPLTTLYNGLINERKKLNSEINSVLNDSIEVVYPGYGVYGKWESGLLTEKLCEEYNLVCDRW